MCIIIREVQNSLFFNICSKYTYTCNTFNIKQNSKHINIYNILHIAFKIVVTLSASIGHTICQPCKRNPNIGRKCPTCRQEIIGRATSMEKIVAALYKKSTGMDPPIDLNDDVEREERSPNSEGFEQLVEMIFSVPVEGHRVLGARPVEEGMGQELERLFNNLSVIQMTRPTSSRR